MSRREQEPTRPLLATRDLEEAHHYVTDVYVPHELVTRDGHALDFTLRHLALDKVTIGHLAYGADAELVVPPMGDCYHMNLAVAGRTMVAQHGHRAAAEAGRSGILFAPDAPLRVRWSPDAVQYAVKLPRRPLERHLARMLNRPVERPIRFALGFDARTPLARSLFACVEYLRVELARPGGLAEFAPVREQAQSMLLTQLLLAVPHNHSELLHAPAPAAADDVVRRATDLV
ncbi:cupin domain-containing protein, partial [Pseudonocardia ailaonensis]